ncbi:MAG: hypothetical protein WAK18_10140 [Nocardioidaceae bacterium]
MKKILSTAAALALSAAALAVAPTTTASADSYDSPWIRYHQPDVDVAAGHACSFAVHEHVLRDKEYYKVLATYADGTDQAELWKGPLVMRYTNVDTGASKVVNISGRARITYYRDGSFASITILTGHFGATMPPGNEMAAGLYRVGGKDSAMTIEPDGKRYLVLGPHGSTEDLCAALSS